VKQHYQLSDLLAIMATLRDPQKGCPWDRKQDFASIVPCTLEEAYEVADAIEQGDFEGLKGELGDLLFQVVFYAQLAREQQWFDFEAVVDAICRKLVSRHPHVFGDLEVADEAEIKANWERIKATEREASRQGQDKPPSVLDNIPAAMPALTRALKIQKRCAHVGFDWATLGPVADKVTEELNEVLEEVQQVRPDPERIAEELGDLLFASVNLVRHLRHEPEQVLRQANRKFEKRFREVERRLGEQGKSLEQCSLEEMDAVWRQVKETFQN